MWSHKTRRRRGQVVARPVLTVSSNTQLISSAVVCLCQGFAQGFMNETPCFMTNSGVQAL